MSQKRVLEIFLTLFEPENAAFLAQVQASMADFDKALRGESEPQYALHPPLPPAEHEAYLQKLENLAKKIHTAVNKVEAVLKEMQADTYVWDQIACFTPEWTSQYQLLLRSKVDREKAHQDLRSGLGWLGEIQAALVEQAKFDILGKTGESKAIFLLMDSLLSIQKIHKTFPYSCGEGKRKKLNSDFSLFVHLLLSHRKDVLAGKIPDKPERPFKTRKDKSRYNTLRTLMKRAHAPLCIWLFQQMTSPRENPTDNKAPEPPLSNHTADSETILSKDEGSRFPYETSPNQKGSPTLPSFSEWMKANRESSTVPFFSRRIAESLMEIEDSSSPDPKDNDTSP